MPLITIQNTDSAVRGRLAAWFDQDKPRVATKDAKKKAFKRVNQALRANSKKYFIADDNLEHEVLNWQKAGSPKQWDIRGIHG